MSAEDDKWMHYIGKPIPFNIPEGVSGPIYCIGDSHIRVLPDACPEIFKTADQDGGDIFASKTAYAIGSTGHDQYIGAAGRKIPDGSKIIFSFGEIDCRHYIPKLAKKHNRAIADLAGEVVQRYMDNCLSSFISKFKVMVMGPYLCPHDHAHEENKFDDIHEAKTLLNARLQDLCESTGMLYIPLFKAGLEAGWDTSPIGTYFGDTSHASGCMVPVILESMRNFKWEKQG